ncbi:hypothetical protein ACWGCW_07490 [Streptomyces sp. NPDC054933]
MHSPDADDVVAGCAADGADGKMLALAEGAALAAKADGAVISVAGAMAAVVATVTKARRNFMKTSFWVRKAE